MGDKIDLNKAEFFVTVNDLKFLPTSSEREVAFVGRSNVGKSSLLNTITRRNKLAYISKTPGRTQHINYFSLIEDRIFLVDLPGYGYAKVPEKIRKHWVLLLSNYLQQRKQLVGLVLIMDARRPLRDLDYQMLDFFGITGKPILLVLSKEDKLTFQEKTMLLTKVKQELLDKGYSHCSVSLFSALKRVGVTELVTTITSWLD